MGLLIQHKRGNKATLPSLNTGELALTTDANTEQLYIGTGSGNKLVGRVLSGTTLVAFSASLHPTGSFFLVTGGTDTGEENDLYISTGSAWVKVGVNQLSDLAGSLDDIADGVTYGKVLASNLTSGQVNQIDDGANNVTAAQARGHIDDTTTNPHNVGMSDLSDYDANNNKIVNVTTPTANGDAVNKEYADSISAGLDPKESVRAGTTATLTLATDVENGDTIDGVVLATGDRILVKDQADASENGIYIVTTGAPTRSLDFDGTPTNEVDGGEYVFVIEGTANAGNGFVVINADLNFSGTGGYCVVGTDDIDFSQYSGAGSIIAGTGLTKSGSTINAIGGNGITANANDLEVDYGTTGTGELQTVDSNSDGTPDAGSLNLAARIDHKHILDDIDCGVF